jgi:hypothetical protein
MRSGIAVHEGDHGGGGTEGTADLKFNIQDSKNIQRSTARQDLALFDLLILNFES